MKIDGRQLSHQTLEELRIRTIQQVKDGMKPSLLAQVLGISRAAIYKWIDTDKKFGIDGLKAKPISGRPAKVGVKEMKWLSKALIEKMPNQLKLPFALWTRSQVKELIRMKFGIYVGKTAVTRILKELGYTFQKPATRFAQQDPIIVKKWQEEDYPKIKREARKKGASIYFGDEANVSTVSYKLAKTIGKLGVTPIVARTSQRFKVNMLSAVSSQGGCRFMVTENMVNAEVFIEFLKRLIKGSEAPVYLILDNHPIHKSKKVTEFVIRQNGMLKLFFLPPYSPELNPDEMVWNSVKNNELSRNLIGSFDALKIEVYRSLYSLQKRAEKIKSFFRTKTTSYAQA